MINILDIAEDLLFVMKMIVFCVKMNTSVFNPPD